MRLNKTARIFMLTQDEWEFLKKLGSGSAVSGLRILIAQKEFLDLLEKSRLSKKNND